MCSKCRRLCVLLFAFCTGVNVLHASWDGADFRSWTERLCSIDTVGFLNNRTSHYWDREMLWSTWTLRHEPLFYECILHFICLIFGSEYASFIAVSPIKDQNFLSRSQAMLCFFSVPVLINNSELTLCCCCCFFNAVYGGTSLASVRLYLLTLN